MVEIILLGIMHLIFVVYMVDAIESAKFSMYRLEGGHVVKHRKWPKREELLNVAKIFIIWLIAALIFHVIL